MRPEQPTAFGMGEGLFGLRAALSQTTQALTSAYGLYIARLTLLSELGGLLALRFERARALRQCRQLKVSQPALTRLWLPWLLLPHAAAYREAEVWMNSLPVNDRAGPR
jgi:hypothetical protein